MKLIEYLPEFLREILEFKELFKAEDVEVEKLLSTINSLEKEVIVNTAKTYGLERYEKIYGITDIAETIEGRRANILLKMNNKAPFTMNWLINTLNVAIGER